MPSRSRGIGIVVAALVTCGAAPAAAQVVPAPSPSAVGGEDQLSPRVLVSWFGKPGSHGVAALQLAVVWRGRAGWLASGIRGRSTFAMPTRTLRSASGETRTIPSHPASSEYTIGGITFGVEYDPATGTAKVLGRQITLGSDNVILVDGMGESRGPKIVGKARVASTLRGERRLQVAPLLRASPDVAAFLR